MDKVSIGQVVYIHPELGDVKRFPYHQGPGLNDYMRDMAGTECVVAGSGAWYELNSEDGEVQEWAWDRRWFLTEEELSTFCHWDRTDEEIIAIL